MMDIRLNQAYSFHQLGQREYQEDARYPDLDVPDINQRFFVVCDGVGGCDKGEVASQTVCESFKESMSDIDFSEDFANTSFNQVLDAAYNALDGKVNKSNREMATTLTFVCFHGGGCTMAHIGDSRIYQIRPSEGIIYRSNDHSMVNTMVHNGVLTPEQGLNHPQNNVITRYMGPVESDEYRCMATVMRTIDVAAGDYFFMCSDGVLHKVSDDELVEILTSKASDEDKMRLIAQKSENSEDNNTAYLISVAEVYDDPTLVENAEITDEDTHETKKIKVASQNLEEIESIQPDSGNSIWNWFKNLLK
jgi:protein phosphatase